jgi:hypothetical protein
VAGNYGEIEGLRKATKIPKMVGFPTENRTALLSNTSHNRYRLIHFARSFRLVLLFDLIFLLLPFLKLFSVSRSCSAGAGMWLRTGSLGAGDVLLSVNDMSSNTKQTNSPSLPHTGRWNTENDTRRSAEPAEPIVELFSWFSTAFQLQWLLSKQPDAVHFVKKVRLSLGLANSALRHEDLCGSGCIDPRLLDLDTSWRWVISFTLRPLYPLEKNFLVHIG